MQWKDGEESSNVDDVRGSSGGGGLPFGGRSIGIGAIVVALLGSYFLGVDPSVILSLLSGGGGGTPQVQQPAPPAPDTNGGNPATEDPQVRFVRVVVRETETAWTQMFQARNATYQPPRLEIFRGSYPTACGQGQAASGPFYCPADQKVYLDLDFFQMLEQRFQAPGDFARAYVIAHEVGHHVQKLLGITAKTDALRERLSATDYNKVSVRVELQADCFAGVWGHWMASPANQSRVKLDPGDTDEALRAATSIGDDTLQKQARGTVVPDSFTHGTSAQRVSWFKRGLDAGDIEQCDTFSANSL
jgi:predicted metalloprotease